VTAAGLPPKGGSHGRLIHRLNAGSAKRYRAEPAARYDQRMISFGKRLALAFSAWFSIIGSGQLPDDVMATLVKPEPPPAAPTPPAPPPPDPGHRAIQVLAILQRDGRLVDFLMEDLTAYDDAQIGAAVRDVHNGARQALQRYFTLEPVLDDEEGRPIALERNVDAARVKVVGSVTGSAPLRGILRHRGWEATRVSLPPLPASGHNIVAPAEVEVS
jgi:Domain of unknown function (DUF2760)